MAIMIITGTSRNKQLIIRVKGSDSRWAAAAMTAAERMINDDDNHRHDRRNDGNDER